MNMTRPGLVGLRSAAAVSRNSRSKSVTEAELAGEIALVVAGAEQLFRLGARERLQVFQDAEQQRRNCETGRQQCGQGEEPISLGLLAFASCVVMLGWQPRLLVGGALIGVEQGGSQFLRGLLGERQIRADKEQRSGEKHEQHAQPSDETAAQQPQAKEQSGPGADRRDRLLADVFDQRGEQVLLLLVMPRVEPDRTRIVLAQEVAQDVHQRGLAAPPRAGNRDRDRRLGLRVADEHEQAAGDRRELQRVHIVESDGAVGRGLVGDRGFAGGRTNELAGGGGRRHHGERKGDEHDPWRCAGDVAEARPALPGVMRDEDAGVARHVLRHHDGFPIVADAHGEDRGIAVGMLGIAEGGQRAYHRQDEFAADRWWRRPRRRRFLLWQRQRRRQQRRRFLLQSSLLDLRTLSVRRLGAIECSRSNPQIGRRRHVRRDRGGADPFGRSGAFVADARHGAKCRGDTEDRRAPGSLRG